MSFADTTGPEPVIELRSITKRFGAVLANDGIDFAVHPGEVHALLGENGAGKSTLTRIMYGLSQPDSGEIRIDGRPATLSSPAAAIAAGIGIVTQEFSLVGPMTVADNLALNGVGWGRVDRAAIAQRIERLAAELELDVDPTAIVDELSVGERQRVEVIKALLHDCRVLILDEPTAVLVPHDVARLCATIGRLAAGGMGVVFISHKLHEVTAIADTVTVLRRGRTVATHAAAGVSVDMLAATMIGDLADVALASAGHQGRSPVARTGTALLDLADVTVAGHARSRLDVDRLQAWPGEIVGVAGVSGNGQSELVGVLDGSLAPTTGTVGLDGDDIAGLGLVERAERGLARLRDDRATSVVPDMSVEMTLALERLDTFRRWRMLDRAAIRRHADDLIERFDIRAAPTDPMRSLSGGNVQKVLLARALRHSPDVLVVSQPTRGLDIGACEFVYAELDAVRNRGGCVIVISEDLDELLRLCDRIVVLASGRLVGEVDPATTTPTELGLMMTADVSAHAAGLST